jgi:superfamily II DNA or RNA helicase
MPTGTGKTETMLALLAHGTIDRLLVIVPSNPLRMQTYRKFLTHGLLPQLGVLSEGFLYPVAGRLDHCLKTAEDAEQLFTPCNVVVATIQALANSEPEATTKVLELCSHLFLDEAHHVAAPSWRDIKTKFAGKSIVQFTATPYRRDGKRVDGRIIYNYPLRKAQEEGYFAAIQYRPIFRFDIDAADKAIAETAVTQLRDDLGNERDHILMARTATIKRAEKIIEVYRELAEDFKPIFIHSQMGVTKQREALQAVRSRTSRIVVCVDMLGEGFDLPQLKIAAIHDVHKSLAITLQFTGRFTRSAGENLGTATMVANAGDISMEHALRQLYAEDADWNRIIQQLGEGAVGQRVAQTEFLATFPCDGICVPLENILPKMSTVIYKTTCDDWTPDKIAELVPPEIIYVEPVWSDEHKVALFVTREFEEIPWGDIREMQNLTWHLYLLFWDADNNVLYINSSNNEELHQDLARAVCAQTAERVKGEPVYRALHNINRFMLMNLGLLHAAGRAIRHTMHNGSDVGEQLKPGQLGNKAKTNLFGRGYENGERVSLGCSLKGRIWSYKAAESIPEWVAWCKAIGAKVLDNSITEEQVLNGVLRPESITARPQLVPLAIDWNSQTYLRSESALLIRIGDVDVPFFETELKVLDYVDQGDIRFAVAAESGNAEYEAQFRNDGIDFLATGFEACAVVGRGRLVALSDFFRKEPPTILFEQDTFIEDNLLFKVHGDSIGPYNREQIEVWDWTGIDLSVESQTEQKRTDSIQRRVLNELCADPAWEIVFDDDSSGEAADILAIKREGTFIHINFYHCKYAHDGSVGARVGDLYEVCGQAQKSIRWRENIDRLLEHLKLREARRIRDGKPSRMEKGDAKILFELMNNAHLLKPICQVCIIQPGLSKTKATNEQLRLLGATELYLSETFAIPLRIIANA